MCFMRTFIVYTNSRMQRRALCAAISSTPSWPARSDMTVYRPASSAAVAQFGTAWVF